MNQMMVGRLDNLTTFNARTDIRIKGRVDVECHALFNDFPTTSDSFVAMISSTETDRMHWQHVSNMLIDVIFYDSPSGHFVK